MITFPQSRAGRRRSKAVLAEPAVREVARALLAEGRQHTVGEILARADPALGLNKDMVTKARRALVDRGELPAVPRGWSKLARRTAAAVAGGPPGGTPPPGAVAGARAHPRRYLGEFAGDMRRSARILGRLRRHKREHLRGGRHEADAGGDDEKGGPDHEFARGDAGPEAE